MAVSDPGHRRRRQREEEPLCSYQGDAHGTHMGRGRALGEVVVVGGYMLCAGGSLWQQWSEGDLLCRRNVEDIT